MKFSHTSLGRIATTMYRLSVGASIDSLENRQNIPVPPIFIVDAAIYAAIFSHARPKSDRNIYHGNNAVGTMDKPAAVGPQPSMNNWQMADDSLFLFKRQLEYLMSIENSIAERKQKTQPFDEKLLKEAPVAIAWAHICVRICPGVTV